MLFRLLTSKRKMLWSYKHHKVSSQNQLNERTDEGYPFLNHFEKNPEKKYGLTLICKL